MSGSASSRGHLAVIAVKSVSLVDFCQLGSALPRYNRRAYAH
jgi:hypothetical protein